MGSYFISDIIKSDPTRQTLSDASRTLDSIDDSITQVSSIAFQLDKFLQAEEANKSIKALKTLEFYNKMSQQDFTNKLTLLQQQDDANRFMANNDLSNRQFNETVRVNDFNMKQSKLNYDLSVRKQDFYENAYNNNKEQNDDIYKQKATNEYTALLTKLANKYDNAPDVATKGKVLRDIDTVYREAIANGLKNVRYPKMLNYKDSKSKSVATQLPNIVELNSMYMANPNYVKNMIREAMNTKNGKTWLNNLAINAVAEDSILGTDANGNPIKLSGGLRDLIIRRIKNQKIASKGVSKELLQTEKEAIRPMVEEFANSKLNMILSNSSAFGKIMPNWLGSNYRELDIDRVVSKIASKNLKESTFLNGVDTGITSTEAKLMWLKDNFDKAFDVSLLDGTQVDFGVFSTPAFDAAMKLNKVLDGKLLGKKDLEVIKNSGIVNHVKNSAIDALSSFYDFNANVASKLGIKAPENRIKSNKQYKDKDLQQVWKKIVNSKQGRDLIKAVNNYIVATVRKGKDIDEINNVILPNGKILQLTREEVEWLGSYGLVIDLFGDNMRKEN